MAGIGRRIAKGAAWTILMQFAVRSIGIVSTLILARLLIPEDFGLVAMATVVWALLEGLSRFDFEIPLIRQRDPERHHYDTVWTLNIIKGVSIGVLIAALAAPAAAFYGDPRLEMIVYALTPVALLNAFANPGVVDFRRELQFHKDFVYFAARKFGAFAVAIPLAFFLRDYWALVWGIIAASCVQLVMSYLLHPFRPRLSLAAASEYFSFSKWLVVSGFVQFLTLEMDRLVLGKILNAASLGIYRMAHEISFMVSTELLLPIQRALIPGFTKFQHEGDALGPRFLQTVQAVGALVFAVPVGIWIIADLLVPVALGYKWMAAIPLIQILGFCGLLRATDMLIEPILLAAGRVKLQTGLNLCRFVFVVPGLLIGALHLGLEGAAIGVTLGSLCSTIISTSLALRSLGLTWFAFLSSIWRSAVSAGVMVAVLMTVKAMWHTGDDTGAMAAELFGLIALGAATYACTHILVWRLSGAPESVERQALILVRRLARRAHIRIPLIDLITEPDEHSAHWGK